MPTTHSLQYRPERFERIPTRKPRHLCTREEATRAMEAHIAAAGRTRLPRHAAMAEQAAKRYEALIANGWLRDA